MANSNQNEIDELNKNGKLDFDNLNREDRIELDEVEKGQKGQNHLKKKFSIDEFKTLAIENNEILKNLNRYERNMGALSLFAARLNLDKEYSEKELIDKMKVLAPNFIKELNGRGIAQFDAAGNLDLKMVAEIAKRNNLPIPTWIEKIMEDTPMVNSNTKSNVLENNIENTDLKEFFTKKELDRFVKNFDAGFSDEDIRRLKELASIRNEKHKEVINQIVEKMADSGNTEITEDLERDIYKDAIYMYSNRLNNEALGGTVAAVASLFKYSDLLEMVLERGGGKIPEGYEKFEEELIDFLDKNLKDKSFLVDGKIDIEKLKTIITHIANEKGIRKSDLQDFDVRRDIEEIVEDSSQEVMLEVKEKYDLGAEKRIDPKLYLIMSSLYNKEKDSFGPYEEIIKEENPGLIERIKNNIKNNGETERIRAFKDMTKRKLMISMNENYKEDDITLSDFTYLNYALSTYDSLFNYFDDPGLNMNEISNKENELGPYAEDIFKAREASLNMIKRFLPKAFDKDGNLKKELLLTEYNSFMKKDKTSSIIGFEPQNSIEGMMSKVNEKAEEYQSVYLTVAAFPDPKTVFYNSNDIMKTFFNDMNKGIKDPNFDENMLKEEEIRNEKNFGKYALNDLLSAFTGEVNEINIKNKNGINISSARALGVYKDYTTKEAKEEIMINSALIFLRKYVGFDGKPKIKDIKEDYSDFPDNVFESVKGEAQRVISDYLPNAFEDGKIDYKKLNYEYFKFIKERGLPENYRVEALEELFEKNAHVDLISSMEGSFNRREKFKYYNDNNKDTKLIENSLEEKLHESGQDVRDKMSYIKVLSIVGNLMEKRLVDRKDVKCFIKRLKVSCPFFKEEDPERYLYMDISPEDTKITQEKVYLNKFKEYNKFSGRSYQEQENEQPKDYEILKDILAFAIDANSNNNKSKYCLEAEEISLKILSGIAKETIVDGKPDVRKLFERINEIAEKNNHVGIFKGYENINDIIQERRGHLSQKLLSNLRSAIREGNIETVRLYGDTYSEGQAEISKIMQEKRKESEREDLVTNRNAMIKSIISKAKVNQDGELSKEDKRILLESAVVIVGLEGFSEVDNFKTEGMNQQADNIYEHKIKEISPERKEAMKNATKVLKKFFPNQSIISEETGEIDFEVLENAYRNQIPNFEGSIIKPSELKGNISIIPLLTKRYFGLMDKNRLSFCYEDQMRMEDILISDAEVDERVKANSEDLDIGVNEDKVTHWTEGPQEEFVQTQMDLFGSTVTEDREDTDIKIYESNKDIKQPDAEKKEKTIESNESEGEGVTVEKIEISEENTKEVIQELGDTVVNNEGTLKEYSGPVKDEEALNKPNNRFVNFVLGIGKKIQDVFSGITNRGKKAKDNSIDEVVDNNTKENQIIPDKNDNPLQMIEGFKFSKPVVRTGNEQEQLNQNQDYDDREQ